MSIARADSFIASLNFEAYRVGGSVRDELLGRAPKDADYIIRGASLVTLGLQLKAALRVGGYPKPSVKPLMLRDGRQAGWRVSARGLGCIEIVLPRTERPRPPKPGENVHRAFDIVVDPELSLAEDAERRDFTFNALYRTVRDLDGRGMPFPGVAGEEIVDPTGRGLHDLQHRVINITHADSFRDDPLRTLRALRFVSVLGYELGPETHHSMCAHAAAVTGLSAKGYASGTVLDELSKLLMGDNCVAALRLARDTGVLAAILPELKPMLGFDQGSRYHDLTTDEHTFKALGIAAHVDAPLRVRWALFFHDSGKPHTAWIGEDGRKHYYKQFENLTRASIMHAPGTATINRDHEDQGERLWRRAATRLNAPKPLREDVALLIREHMVPTNTRSVGVRARRGRVRLGDELYRDLLMHRMCDLGGKDGLVSRKQIEKIGYLEAARRDAATNAVPASVKDLAINGLDAQTAGLSGRDIGAALASILDEVVCDPSDLKRTREWQLSRLERWKA